jgi:LytS/YehU family sensor histidine kinase
MPRFSAHNFECHAGLIQVAVPICFEGKLLGALVCGEIAEKKPEMQQRDKIGKLAAELNLDQEELRRAYAQLTPWGKGKVKTVGRLLETMVACTTDFYYSRLNEEKLKLEKTLKIAELKTLQSQINPHFLLNALNTIFMMALMEEAQETQKLIKALAALLKNNLQKERKMTTLREELAVIDDYLFIQKTRFGDRLQVEKEIDPVLLEMEVPQLILQPLVENAVMHGIEPKEEPGLLKLAGWREGELVYFSIEDDGVGMTEKRLQEVRRCLSDIDGDCENMGLFNVHKRCRLLYGAGFGLTVKSVPGLGTRVLLVLPLGAKISPSLSIPQTERKLQVK